MELAIMAPVVFPELNRESYLIDGTGALLLTQEQRTARVLSVSIEKVRISPREEYYNFRLPEPQSFWGYIQWMDRDFVVDTIQLEYRRQSLLDLARTSPDETEQIRCLVRESALLIFDNIAPLLLAAGADAEAIGRDRANYLLAAGQPRLLPVEQSTSLWYEIESGFGGYISISWGGYPMLCGDTAGRQVAPSASPPGKGDSGDSGTGGGGTRPAEPPPPDRSADPDSDSPAPPPDVPSGPDSPVPAAPPDPGIYVANFRLRLCLYSSRTGRYYMSDSFGSVTGPGPFTVGAETVDGTPRLLVVDAVGGKTVVLSGSPATTAQGCPENSSVVIVSQSPV